MMSTGVWPRPPINITVPWRWSWVWLKINSIGIFLACFVYLFTWSTTAIAYSPEVNYVLHCQGCHLEDGSATGEDIPALTEAVNFLKVPGGREFLIQVPGVAGAPISDLELSELMNWMLRQFSTNELPGSFRPYTEGEVRHYRQAPLESVGPVRRHLLDAIDDL